MIHCHRLGLVFLSQIFQRSSRIHGPDPDSGDRTHICIPGNNLKSVSRERRKLDREQCLWKLFHLFFSQIRIWWLNEPIPVNKDSLFLRRVQTSWYLLTIPWNCPHNRSFDINALKYTIPYCALWTFCWKQSKTVSLKKSFFLIREQVFRSGFTTGTT